jgi:hypothetical protein
MENINANRERKICIFFFDTINSHLDLLNFAKIQTPHNGAKAKPTTLKTLIPSTIGTE